MAPQNNTQRVKPWPGYFIVRTSGEVVPLIAVDELPPGTNLLGVPRSLDLESTIGMLNLGLQRSSGSFYQISGSNEKNAATADLSCSSKASQPAAQPSAHCSTTNTPTTTPHSLSPRTSQPRISHLGTETQICRHWCAHGICKWGQHCRYLHTMPMTLPGLHAVGLRDWPTWYRALNSGYFVSPGEGSKPVTRRPRAGSCAGGGRCTAAASNAVLAQLGVQRLRNAVPSGEVMKDEDLGEQILERSKNIQRGRVSSEIVRHMGTGKKGHINRNVMPERAAVNDTKDGEEERGGEVDVERVTDKKGRGVTKQKLVDV